MGSQTRVPKREGIEPLTGKERAQLVNRMTSQVMESMAGKNSELRYDEAEVAESMRGKPANEQRAILDMFAETLESNYPFVGTWNASLKPSTYMDEDGKEVKGQTVLDRKLLERNVRALMEASVGRFLEQVLEMGNAASKGEVSRGHVELGIVGGAEFNGAIAKALVENLPEKLGGTVRVDAEKNKSEDYTGKILLSWVGDVGETKVEISFFTGKPVGSKRA